MNNFRIIIVICILTIIGYSVIPKLSVRLNPQKSLPELSIDYNLYGSDPTLIETNVTTILESSIAVIGGINELTSVSFDGGGRINIKFDGNENIDLKKAEISSIIRQVYPKLPPDLSYPRVSSNRVNTQKKEELITFSIYSTDDRISMEKVISNYIRPRIGSLDLVDYTSIYGLSSSEFVIEYNFDIIKSLDIELSDIITRVEERFHIVDLGKIKQDNQYTSVQLKNNVGELNWHIPIKKNGNRIIYLDDIASIKESEQRAQSLYRINGINSINLSIYSEIGANDIELGKLILSEIEDIKLELPRQYNITKVYDSTESLKIELNKIYKRSFFTLIILFVFVYFFTFDFRYLLIVLLSFMSNLGLSFLFFYIFNIEIQLYSIAGITISLGLIIDNIIIVLDSIRYSKKTNIYLPLLASSLTTIGALGIIFFLDERLKINLIDFALVIIINIATSIFIAFLLVPVLADKYLKTIDSSEYLSNRRSKFINSFIEMYKFIISVQLKYRNLFVLFIILVFGIPLFLLPKEIENKNNSFARLYNITVGSNFYNFEVRPYLDRYLGGSLRLFNEFVLETANYDENKPTKLLIKANINNEMSINQINDVFIRLETYLKQFSEIKQFKTHIKSKTSGVIEISFKEKYSSKFVFPVVLKSKLMTKVMDYGGIEWSITGIGNGFNSGGVGSDPANFSILAKGYNYIELIKWSELLRTDLEEEPRINKVILKDNSVRSTYSNSSTFFMNMNPEELVLNSINQDQFLQNIFSSIPSNSFNNNFYININDELKKIRLTPIQADEFNLWRIKNNFIDSIGNQKKFISLDKKSKLLNITKTNQEYTVRLDYRYSGNKDYGKFILDKLLKSYRKKLPIGYTLTNEKEERKNRVSVKFKFLLLIGLGSLFIYYICTIFFGNLKQAFIVIGMLPISFIGIFLIFYTFNYQFDRGGFTSFVLTSGISVNTSIYIIFEYNDLKKNHSNLNSLIVYLKAFRSKIYPILLMLLSSILGFVPFVILGQNEKFWFSLGIGTIGGLIFCFLGLLFYLPLFVVNKEKLKNI